MGIKEVTDASQAAAAALEKMAAEDEAAAAGKNQGEPSGEPAKAPVDGAGGAGAAAPPKVDGLVRMSYRGREIEVPIEEALRYAEMGVDYSTKMAELKKTKEQLEAAAVDKQLMADFVEYRDYLRQNPELARTIADMAKQYDEKRVLPKLAWEDGQQVGTTDARLRQELEAVNARLRQMESAQKQAALDAAITQAVASRPLFAGNKQLGDTAREKLAAMLRADETLTPEAAALIVEGEAQQWLNTLRGGGSMDEEAARRKAADKARFGATERPGGIPTGEARPQGKVYTPDDLKAGVVRRDVEAFLRGQ